MTIDDAADLLIPRFKGSMRLPNELETPLKALEDLADKMLKTDPMPRKPVFTPVPLLYGAEIKLDYHGATGALEVDVYGKVCGKHIPETSETPAETPWVEDMRVMCGSADITGYLSVEILEAFEAEILGETP